MTGTKRQTSEATAMIQRRSDQWKENNYQNTCQNYDCLGGACITGAQAQQTAYHMHSG